MSSSTLTAPADKVVTRTQDGRARVQCSSMEPATPPLNPAQLEAASGDLLDTTMMDTSYPKVERRYAYPAYKGQKFVGLSFVPSLTAVPDKDGFFGMLRVWGTFDSPEEGEAHGRTVITQHDSYHPYHLGRTGYPLPITTDRKWSETVSRVDLQAKTERVVSESVKEKIGQEKAMVKDMMEREKALLDEQDPDREEEPEDQLATILTRRYEQLRTIMRARAKVRNYKRMLLKSQRDFESFRERVGDAAFGEMFSEACGRIVKARAEGGVSCSKDFLEREFSSVERHMAGVDFSGLSADDKKEPEMQMTDGIAETAEEEEQKGPE